MRKHKIGWCSMTWNPVVGCLNHCEYCYARGIAKRFWKRMWEIEANHQWKQHPGWAWTGDHLSGLKDFKPTFLNAQFEKKFPKKPQRIFVGSMSEIYYWEKEWIEMVIEKVKQYPQHTFQFLTKFPRIYSQWAFPLNCWLGITVTGQEENINEQKIFAGDNANLEYRNIKFISFEPLLQKIYPEFMTDIDWVILGAETGNRKNKVIPKLEWILDILHYCQKTKIPIYLKDSLYWIYKDIYPKEIKEFPKRR